MLAVRKRDRERHSTPCKLKLKKYSTRTLPSRMHQHDNFVTQLKLHVAESATLRKQAKTFCGANSCIYAAAHTLRKITSMVHLPSPNVQSVSSFVTDIVST